MAYYYATVAGVFPVPDPEKGPTIVYSTRLLMEHALFDMKILAERIDQPDGTRVFRTEERFIERMQRDQIGPVILFGDTKIYWTPVNPVGTSRDTKSRWRAL